MLVAIKDIIVPAARRPLDEAKVAEIAGSIKAIGLLSPIGVRSLNQEIELVFGAHRLAACRNLGWQTIEAIGFDSVCARDLKDFDDLAYMWQIAENLHRAELTTQQRNEHLADWVKLLEGRKEDIGGAPPISKKPGRKPSAAIAEVAEASGIGVKTVKEAVAASKVSSAVKAAADRAELSQKQRLAISRLATEAEQLEAVATRTGTASDNRFAPPAPALTATATKKHSGPAKPKTKTALASDPIQERCDDCNTAEQHWQRSLSNLAGDAISMRAFWTRKFGDWETFDVPSSLVALAKQAATIWTELAADLTKKT